MIEILSSDMTIALVLGLIISLILGPITIPLLTRLKFGQNIREDGPKSHMKKAGTPTIGGIIFFIATAIVMFVMGFKLTDEAMIALYTFLAFGFVGFMDDMLKIIKKKNEGLKAWQKMVMLIVFSLVIAIYGYTHLGTDLRFPFTHFSIQLGVFYIPFVVLYYAATTNAVNLTDGLDGLASTITVLVLTFFAIVAFFVGNEGIAVFSMALIGGLIGFLRFNAYPAKVFMGDTGSLALGAAIATIALMLNIPLILIIVGGVYVFETLSVILQVSSFKLTGKRIFKMAPIHHHFEQLGWSEVKIVTVFSCITVILCFIGFLAL